MMYVCSMATCSYIAGIHVFCLHAENQEVVTTWHNIMAANPAVVKFLSSFVNKGYVTILLSQNGKDVTLLFMP